MDVDADSYENSTKPALERKVYKNQHSELPCSDIIKQCYKTSLHFKISQYLVVGSCATYNEDRYPLMLNVHTVNLMVMTCQFLGG